MISETIKNVKPDMAAIPAFASLTESAYYIIEANERDFTEMIKSIGIRELGIFESTGSVLLYEANDKETEAVAADKENWFTKVWARIKALFEKFLHLINDIHIKLVNAVGKKALGSDKAKLEAAVSKLSDKFEIKTYEYTRLKDQITGTKVDSDEVFKPNSDSNNMEEIRKWLRGDDVTINKTNLSQNIGKIIAAVEDYNTTVNNVKGIYKSYQKKYNDRIAKAKEVAGEDKEKLNAMKMECNNEILFLSVLLSEYQRMYITNANIIIKLANASNKKEAKKSEDANQAKNQEDIEDITDPTEVGESAMILTEAQWKFWPEFKQPKLAKLKDELTDIENFAKDKYDEDMDTKLPKILDACLRVLDIIQNIGDVLSVPACLTIIGIPFYCLQRCWSWAFRGGQEALARDRFKNAISKLERIRDKKCKTAAEKKQVQEKIDKLTETMKKAEKEGGKSVDESAFDSELSSLFDWTY